MEKILEKIELIRKEKGIKQEVLAEILGIKQPAYSNYISRESDITWSRLLQISNAFGMDVIDVITYPVKYIPSAEQCESCKEKDKIIQNLNEYIEVLKKRNN
ncbi:MAG: helix-turn-helix domain-containing protein [Bacteroidales bacterium]|nr:helix-turn-helix domain-containing protein [Bacteroidales bacterium]